MGSAASIVSEEAKKPDDASDVKSLDDAKNEIIRLRALAREHAVVEPHEAHGKGKKSKDDAKTKPAKSEKATVAHEKAAPAHDVKSPTKKTDAKPKVEADAKAKVEVPKAEVEAKPKAEVDPLEAMRQAKLGLAEIKKKDFAELKAMNIPPNPVLNTLGAVAVLLAEEPGGGMKDWKAIKKDLLADIDNLLNLLQYFDEDKVSAKVLEELKDYTSLEHFNPKDTKLTNTLCGQLCEWVLAVEAYAKLPKKAVVKPLVAAPAAAAAAPAALDHDNLDMKQLPQAVEAAHAAGKWPLFVDPSGRVDTYYSYSRGIIVDTKMYVAKKATGTPFADILEEMRGLLVAAAIQKPGSTGNPLVIAMTKSAPDFNKAFGADPTKFPLAVFEKSKITSVEVCKLFVKPEELKLNGGLLMVAKDFEVVFTSTFEKEDYVEFLKDQMPIDKLMCFYVKQP